MLDRFLTNTIPVLKIFVKSYPYLEKSEQKKQKGPDFMEHCAGVTVNTVLECDEVDGWTYTCAVQWSLMVMMVHIKLTMIASILEKNNPLVFVLKSLYM